MSSVIKKTMVYLGLSDEDYPEMTNTRDERLSVSAPRAGADYSRGTTSIRPVVSPPEPSPATVSPITRTTPPPAPVVTSPRVHVVEPLEFADAQDIGDQLRNGQPVCVTLADVDADLARRLIDFCSGCTYVLGGTMERIARNVFLLIPEKVEVSKEERQRLRDRGLLYP